VLSHIFFKVIRPGDSEGTFSVFESQADTCFYKRSYRHDRTLHYPFNAERQEGSCEYLLFKSFGLTRQGNKIQVYRLQGGRSNYTNPSLVIKWA